MNTARSLALLPLPSRVTIRPLDGQTPSSPNSIVPVKEDRDDDRVKNLLDTSTCRNPPNRVIIVAERPRTGVVTLKHRFRCL